MTESKTAVVAALAGNASLTLLKGIAAAATGSAAMLAETGHSLADTGNQVLLLVGLLRGAREPDREHPFGYGRDVYFWSFIVAVVLFSLGGGFAIWEAVRRLREGGPLEGPRSWAYAVLAGSFLFEGGSLAVGVRSLRQAAGGRAAWEYWKESRDPTVKTVILEDSVALLSLGIAALGLWLSGGAGGAVWDAAASALIGVLLVGVALVLAVENHSLLLGEPVPHRTEARIRAVARSDPAVRGVGRLRTLHIGPEDVVVALEVAFRPELEAGEIREAVIRLRRAIRRALGETASARLIAVEVVDPDAVASPERGPPHSPRVPERGDVEPRA